MVQAEGKEPIEIPKALPLLPVRDIVIFNHMFLPLYVGRESSISAVDEALSKDRLICIATHKDPNNILGIDVFLDIPNWYRPERLLGLADFLILSRPGCRFSDLTSSPYLSVRKEIMKKLDIRTMPSYSTMLKNGNTAMLLNVCPVTISATDIRTRIAQGKSVKYLLPADVESYILSHKLYAFRKSKDRTVKRECRS